MRYGVLRLIVLVCSFVLQFFLTTAPPVFAQSTATITIDNSIKHQVMEGFGASHGSLVYGGSLGDVLSPDLRARTIDAVFKQVGLTTGNIDTPLLESPGDYAARQNDNTDPFVINPAGFNTEGTRNIKTKLVDMAKPLGFDNFYLSHMVNNKWAAPWMITIRQQDYNRYLDEAAEQVLATALYWRDQYGIVPRYIAPFNEPTSGNGELSNGSNQEIVDIVKRSGARLRQSGFSTIKFIVPNEETVTSSRGNAQALLADPEARQYIGAIGYHAYPYGSSYSFIPKILSESGSGNPNQGEISSRATLKQLAQQYGVQLWMTEVSNGVMNTSMDIRSFDAMRGRAIHIHDELEYANASAFFGMSSMWDRVSQKEHFGNDGGLYGHEGQVVIADQQDNTVYITGMGYAIGHYARWIKRGATRIESRSSDPLVQVSAFNDTTQGKLVTVLINNANTSKTVTIGLTGVGIQGTLAGEQSTQGQFWKPLAAFSPSNSSTISITLPALSVTTLSGATGAGGTTAIPSAQPQAGGKPADANGDGKTDVVDYVVWVNHYGQTTSGKTNGDFTGDGKVDGLDYIVWVTNYGT